MKIIKFVDFINEELLNDTPETYISTVLSQLKRKIDKMFEYEGSEREPKQDTQTQKSIQKAKADAREKSKMSLKDLGLRLESSEISKYSKMYDSLTVTFQDANYMYTMILMIDIKEAIPKDPNKDFKLEDVKNCYIKFKKYDINADFEIIGQISKNVEIKKISEDFIIELKIELDETFGGDEEEFEIETE
jgi:hypothetical protein